MTKGNSDREQIQRPLESLERGHERIVSNANVAITPPDEDHPIQHYIPRYLRSVIFPYHDDFCYTPLFYPRLIVQIMAEGFLPIASHDFLLPKLHHERSVIFLPHQLHRSKSVIKKSHKFYFTINTAFPRVVEGCHRQHDHCWLYPPLVNAFYEIYESTAMEAVLEGGTSKSKVRIYSIEVWQESNLVAGELGYTVGSIYTSLTGFSNVDSAGSVQMAVLGHVLCDAGFTLWDLGMDMEYKRKLGSMLLPRSQFVRYVHSVRGANLTIPQMLDPINCKFILSHGLATSRMTAANIESKSGLMPTTTKPNPQIQTEEPKRHQKRQKSTRTTASIKASSKRCTTVQC